jgi:protein phosphatase 2C family protein 2/3
MVDVNTRYFSNTDRIKKHLSKKSLIPLIDGNKPYRKEYSIRKMNMIKKCDLPLNNNEDKFVSRRNHIRRTASKRNPSINHVKHEQRVPVIPRKRAKSESHKPRKPKEDDMTRYKNLIAYINEKAKKLPAFEKATVSLKKYGPVEGFAVNTHTGYVRVYNEDRVSILLNAQQQFKKSGKINKKFKCSVFSVFDGHGGSQCSNFLKNNLHNSIVEQIDIENLVIPSIKEIYKQIDSDYIKQGMKSKSTLAGSTANTILILNNSVMVINTGDSRTIFSKNRGATVIEGSVDHKPEKLTEFNRIIQLGGELYRMSYNIKTGQNQFYFAKNYSQFNNISELSKSIHHLAFGPWRVKPGGLSLSRSFGDIESKNPIFGGKEGVITSEPDITDFPIEDMDFALLGCKLSS